MFDGGGVPIDHYIIQVDNNTQLEITDLTYSVDVMYNDTLFVNISAHNCAGYSDLISLTLEYDPGIESTLNLLLSYIIMMTTQLFSDYTKPDTSTSYCNILIFIISWYCDHYYHSYTDSLYMLYEQKTS